MIYILSKMSLLSKPIYVGGVCGGSKRCLLIPQICSDRRSALVHFIEDNVVV